LNDAAYVSVPVEPLVGEVSYSSYHTEGEARHTNSVVGSNVPTYDKNGVKIYGETPGHRYVPHQGGYRAYIRDMILGINDGLVSVFLLVVGVVGGGMNAQQTLLAGISAAVGGAISMAFGEYIATKSQSEVTSGDLKLEGEHFQHHRDQEIEQVFMKLQELNLKGDLLAQATNAIGESDQALLEFMKAFEFGCTEEDSRSPIVAMLASGALFLSGAAPSVIPFACTKDADLALIIACSVCIGILFMVGALKTLATRTNWFISGMENLLIGACGGGIVYGVGRLFSHFAGEDLGAA